MSAWERHKRQGPAVRGLCYGRGARLRHSESGCRGEHRLVVMKTTGVVRAMQPERGHGLQYAKRMCEAYRKTTLSHNSLIGPGRESVPISA